MYAFTFIIFFKFIDFLQQENSIDNLYLKFHIAIIGIIIQITLSALKKYLMPIFLLDLSITKFIIKVN